MVSDYDAIVVGAGIAGCLTAHSIVKAGNGKLSVLIVDRNPRSEAGKKNTIGWVCGDAVGEHHTEFVRGKLGVRYGKPEIENRVTAVYVFSPDMETRLQFEGPGYVLDRPKFGRRLLEDALKAGVIFKGNIQATELIAEDGFVKGIKGKDMGSKPESAFEATAKVVIDSSGMATKLRRILPIPSYIEREIHPDDVEPTARVNGVLGDGLEVDPSHCDIYLNQVRAPGGYLWVFPKSSNKVNIGLGIQKKRASKPLKTFLDEWVREEPIFKGFKALSDDSNLSGAWQVSVRHQNDCMVANGYMLVGDSAWCPNPISAGGIGPGLVGGILAGETGARAIFEGDVSQENLWQYNLDYVERYGKKTAALEAFRFYLQTLDNDEINYGMKHFITLGESVQLSSGDIPDMGALDKLKRVFWGLGKFRAFRGLYYTIKQMKALNQLYEDYPRTAAEFPGWKKRVDALLGEARSKFS